jgi:hypothetical protein
LLGLEGGAFSSILWITKKYYFSPNFDGGVQHLSTVHLSTVISQWHIIFYTIVLLIVIKLLCQVSFAKIHI